MPISTRIHTLPEPRIGRHVPMQWCPWFHSRPKSLAAHITERNQCTVQVIASAVEALVHISTCRDIPPGAQTIDCYCRFLQDDDGS